MIDRVAGAMNPPSSLSGSPLELVVLSAVEALPRLLQLINKRLKHA